MQTFLPYPSYEKSARCLDDARLGRQRKDAWLILLALVERDPKRASLPAVKMWRGHEGALRDYGVRVCEQWILRHGRDNGQLRRFTELELPGVSVEPPWWLGYDKLHSSHRAALLAKDPRHYGRFGWREQPAVYGAIWWPSMPAPGFPPEFDAIDNRTPLYARSS